MLNAASIIPFVMSALDTSADAKTTGMSPSMPLRLRACANGLNRSAHQNEKTLATRLRCDQSEAITQAPESIADITEHQVRKAIKQAGAKIATCRNRLANAGPLTPEEASALQGRSKHLCGKVMMDTPARIGVPAQSMVGSPAPAKIIAAEVAPAGAN